MYSLVNIAVAKLYRIFILTIVINVPSSRLKKFYFFYIAKYNWCRTITMCYRNKPQNKLVCLFIILFIYLLLNFFLFSHWGIKSGKVKY